MVPWSLNSQYEKVGFRWKDTMTEDSLGMNIPYPSGKLTMAGENLRVLTRDGTTHTPPIHAVQAQRVCPIIVPTNRDTRKNRKNIDRIMRLTLDCKGGMVVFLCSGKARKEDIATLARSYPELNWIAVDGPYPYDHFHQDFETTYSSLAYASKFDQPQKRNLGLEIARLMNWQAVFFLDDDVAVTPNHIQKAMDLLYKGNASVAGFSAREFPDNSVVVQADKVLNGQVDAFIGSGALAVKVNTPVLSFFPHIYNEDWLFELVYCLFSKDNVVWAGTVKQQSYDPFVTTKRAFSEEPGDMLGESLLRLAMSLITHEYPNGDFETMTTHLIHHANTKFWENEINKRLAYIHTTEEKLRKKPYFRHKRRIIKSLQKARERLVGTDGRGGIRAEELAAWVQAWVRDLNRLNTKKPTSNLPTDLTHVMQMLGFADRCIYSCDTSLLIPLSSVPEAPHQPKKSSAIKVQAHYFDYRSTILRPKAKQGLGNTQIIQDFLAAKGLSMAYIADSTSRLRFDRPIKDSLVSKPAATICMFIEYHESLDLIGQSAKMIIDNNKNKSPLQLVVWVHGSQDQQYEELNLYRNEVTARLILETTGTNVRLRSGIITEKDNDVDRVISKGVSDLAFSYWKCNIPADHFVLVVNSHNEILRCGTFWQFMREEHVMSQQPLSSFLETLPQKIGQQVKNPLTKEDDEMALAKSRSLLIAPSIGERRLRFPRQNPTSFLVQDMKRERLTWSMLDELAYKVVFHDKKGEQLLSRAEGIVCIPVTYKNSLPSDIYMVANAISTALRRHRRGYWGCMIIIHTDQKVAKKHIDSYCKKLIGYISAQYEYDNISFLSLISEKPSLRIANKQRRRLMLTAHYTFWMYNHLEQPKIIWKSVSF